MWIEGERIKAWFLVIWQVKADDEPCEDALLCCPCEADRYRYGLFRLEHLVDFDKGLCDVDPRHPQYKAMQALRCGMNKRQAEKDMQMDKRKMREREQKQ